MLDFTSEDTIKSLMIICQKETMLSEIIVWLKCKNLWEECQKDLSVKIIGENNEI